MAGLQRGEVPSSSRILVPTIPSQFLLDALLGYEFRGYDLGTLLATKGLTRNNLGIPGHHISVLDYSALIKTAAIDMQDASLGFLEDKVPLESYRVFVLGLSGARSVHEIISYGNQFYGLFSTQTVLKLHTHQQECSIQLEFEERSPIDYRFLYQTILLHCTRLLSWLIAEPVRSSAVYFTFEMQEHESSLLYLFGQEILFSQATNQIAIPIEFASAPVSTNMEQIVHMLEDVDTMVLVPENRNPFSGEVRKRILLHKHAYWMESTDAAETMHMSPNLLWRKLQKEGTSFSRIRDEVKRDWALTLMQDRSLSIEEISEQLRYSDTSAFRKAFKKWTGHKSSDYRTRLLTESMPDNGV